MKAEVLTDVTIFEEMARSVEDFDSEGALELTEVALKNGVDPVDSFKMGWRPPR